MSSWEASKNPVLYFTPLLGKLGVIGIKRHKISHTLTLMGPGTMNNLIKPHWIPLPITGLYLEFLEIVPIKESDIKIPR